MDATNHSDFDQGALFTTPIPLKALDDDSRTCPICRERYIEPYSFLSSNRTGSTDAEWAVRVDMVAESVGRKRCCGHILGKKCLERHLQGLGSWRNKCPMCRDVWFDISTTIHSGLNTTQQAHQTSGNQPSSGSLRRSLRLAARAGLDPRPSVRRMGYPNGIGQRNEPNRTARRLKSRNFIHHLHTVLGLVQGSEKVKGTLEEVEQRLAVLYNRRQS